MTSADYYHLSLNLMQSDSHYGHLLGTLYALSAHQAKEFHFSQLNCSWCWELRRYCCYHRWSHANIVLGPALAGYSQRWARFSMGPNGRPVPIDCCCNQCVD